MAVIEIPYNIFTYPGGTRMCLDGLFRAAYTGHLILTNEISPENIRLMALRGEKALQYNANTHKRNLICFIVYRHARIGDLETFVNDRGDFLLNSGLISNIYDPKHRIILDNLLKTGIIQDQDRNLAPF